MGSVSKAIFFSWCFFIFQIMGCTSVVPPPPFLLLSFPSPSLFPFPLPSPPLPFSTLSHSPSSLALSPPLFPLLSSSSSSLPASFFLLPLAPFCIDEELHRQVVTLLRKQERKARQRTGAMSSSDLKGREVRVREHRKVSAPTLSNASVSGEERRRRGRHEK